MKNNGVNVTNSRFSNDLDGTCSDSKEGAGRMAFRVMSEDNALGWSP